MTMNRTPPAGLSVRHDDDSSVLPVSARTNPAEVRIAAEMTETLQNWLHRLSAHSMRPRPTKTL